MGKTHHLDDSDDDSDDDDKDIGLVGDISGVQLGVIDTKTNLLFVNSDWNTWDGGKVGGKPVVTNTS